jgi:hypothetical protein
MLAPRASMAYNCPGLLDGVVMAHKLLRGCVVLVLLVLVPACAEEDKARDERAAEMRHRQDDALKDPMNYSANPLDRSDISGGGLMDFKKDAFKKDVDSALNP